MPTKRQMSVHSHKFLNFENILTKCFRDHNFLYLKSDLVFGRYIKLLSLPNHKSACMTKDKSQPPFRDNKEKGNKEVQLNSSTLLCGF